MGRTVGYIIAGAILGAIFGIVVFVFSDLSNLKLRPIPVGTAAIGALIGFIYSRPANKTFTKVVKTARRFLVYALLAFGFYKCSGFFVIDEKTHADSLLFYAGVMIALCLSYILNIREIAFHSGGQIYPRIGLLIALYILGYISVNNPSSQSYQQGDNFGLFAFMIFIAPLLLIWITHLMSVNDWDKAVKEMERKSQESQIRKAYGLKGWATRADLEQRLGHQMGIHIGQFWHWNEKGHMLLVGGSGQGKGTNLILPALLSDNLVRAGVSVVVLDPKGENAAVAAPHLKERGYDVHVINPFRIPEIRHLGNSRFNPFDIIDIDDPESTDLYDALAMALHNRRGSGDNSFFDNRCRQYISLYLSYAHYSGNANFDTVYDWLLQTGDEREELLATMATSDNFKGKRQAKAILSRLTGESLKTEENIYGTIEEAILIFRNENLLDSLSRSDFDMREISARPTAIFLCIPFQSLTKYAPWVRIFFNFLLNVLTRHFNQQRKVLVLLDECPQLGYIDEVEKSAAVLRGYNVTLWIVVQGLGQLKKLYADSWETFVNSAVIKHWLSMATDNTTADYITHRMPDDIEFVGSNSDGSPKERIKKLLNTSEVLTFTDIICEISGVPAPVRFKKMPYYDSPFNENAAPNPFN